VKTSSLGRRAYIFLNKRWLFDKVYNDYLALPSLRFGYEVSFRTLDKGAIEILGPTGIAKSFQLFVQAVSKVQTGYVYHYAFLMLIGLTFLVLVGGLWDVVSYYVDTRLFFVHLVSFLFYVYFSRASASNARH
jgi:NADH:ubiquinone oxidoreductase subunit 5 (subunit L)/multisubunit Na+/H+ antiporter MnhA subunit